MKAARKDALPGPDSSLEESRNRLLRRVDWRFLLPDPNPRKTNCLSSGPLLEAVRQISETVVEGWKGAPARGCDLAAAVEPDRETLALACSSLRPGGVVYSEWRGAHRRAGLRRRLEGAGFEDVQFFSPHPDPAVGNPAAWIPLRTPGPARHYFLENRGQSRTAWRRVARTVARSASVMRSRWPLVRTVCALARKSDPTGPPPDSSLESFVTHRWESWGLGTAPKILSRLLLTGGLRSESKVVALLFPDSSSRPLVALKMARTPEAIATVRREADVLRALVDRAAPETVGGIPRFLFLDESGGAPVLGETAFSGVPLLSAWTAENYGALALQASTWLADLAGRRPATPPAQWHRRLVEAALDDFARAFGRVLEPELLRESRDLFDALPALPLVCEQRDFSPWNVLLTPAGELAVVDWESAELDGLPVVDLIYFLANVSFSLDSARRTGLFRDSYRAMLDPVTATGSVAEQCLSLYWERLGLDAAVVRPLRVLTWMVHARSEYRRLQADFGTTPGLEILRNAVCVQLFEEELRSGRERDGSRV